MMVRKAKRPVDGRAPLQLTGMAGRVLTAAYEGEKQK